jgi:hypothetical protein
MKKLLMFLCVVFLVIGTHSMVLALPFDIAGPSASNVDTSPATFVTLTTALTGTITDLNVQIEIGYLDTDGVIGAHWGNFEIGLEHNGIPIFLALKPNSDNYGEFDVTFDDDAASGLSYVVLDPDNRSGTYQPVGSLSAFNGLELAGDWTLALLDDVWPGDKDDLISWSINGTTDINPVPIPAAIYLLGAGFIGLAGLRRKIKK